MKIKKILKNVTGIALVAILSFSCDEDSAAGLEVETTFNEDANFTITMNFAQGSVDSAGNSDDRIGNPQQDVVLDLKEAYSDISEITELSATGLVFSPTEIETTKDFDDVNFFEDVYISIYTEGTFLEAGTLIYTDKEATTYEVGETYNYTLDIPVSILESLNESEKTATFVFQISKKPEGSVDFDDDEYLNSFDAKIDVTISLDVTANI